MDGEKILNLVKDWKLHMTCHFKVTEKISSEILSIINADIINAEDSIFDEIIPDIGLFKHLNKI